jgi:hypothetical protein
MASMLGSIDQSLGRILDRLDDLKLADRTIVIFYSDNGGNVHSNTPDDRRKANVKPGHPKYAQLEDWRKWAGDQPPTNNSPLRDGKGRIYEGGIRVPLMIRWPGQTPPGSTSDAIVGPIDIYPTVLEMLRLARPEGQIIDGESLVPVLRQSGELRREAYFTWFPHIQPAVAVRQGDWKLIRRFEPGPDYPKGVELFNLAEDLGESRNLSEEKPEKVMELSALIDAFIQNTTALEPRPNPAYAPNAVPRAAAGGLQGWVAKFSTAHVEGESLVVERDGRSPFIAVTRLGLTGPVEVRARIQSDVAGTGTLQWRTSEQESFPTAGQETPFEMGARTWSDVRVPLAVEGELAHLRVRLPEGAGRVQIDWIEITSSKSDKSRRWDFKAESQFELRP